MPATEPQARKTSQAQPRSFALAGVSMRDLLASCAAAEAVSCPPRAPEPAQSPVSEERTRHREAA
ncbi:hypothetical protein ACFW2D_08520 [Streptomyces sp. NPDC058914]|uniref:hypothetical protein n=1 Tax=Streptomyces sp. NPDC058914 TaxID=3346671 RepID=UPI00367ABD36